MCIRDRYRLLGNTDTESSVQTTYDVPVGPGFEGIYGKDFHFSFYVRKRSENANVDMNVKVVMYRGNQNSLAESDIESISETFNVPVAWQRIDAADVRGDVTFVYVRVR